MAASCSSKCSEAGPRSDRRRHGDRRADRLSGTCLFKTSNASPCCQGQDSGVDSSSSRRGARSRPKSRKEGIFFFCQQLNNLAWRSSIINSLALKVLWAGPAVLARAIRVRAGEHKVFVEMPRSLGSQRTLYGGRVKG